MSMSVVAGIAGGAVFGMIVALLFHKKSKAELESRIERTKEEMVRIRKETGDQLAGLKKSHAEAEKELKASRERVASLEKKTEDFRSKSKKLSSSLQEIESAHARALEESQAHQAAREQAEGRARQAQAQVAEQIERARDLERELNAMQSSQSELREAAERRAEQVHRLRQELEARVGAAAIDDSITAFAETDGSLDGILDVLLQQEQQRAVVLADSNGIVVAAVGDTNLRDGMAAAASLLSKLHAQIGTVVPFGSVRGFRVQDGSSVITGRTFDVAGETVSLATVGPHTPTERVIEGALANLNAVLS